MNKDEKKYGAAPQTVGLVKFPQWQEFMHYLYLPVVIPGQGDEVRLPLNLEFLRGIIEMVMLNEGFVSMDDPRYVYVTARKGFAAPGNPLNRPGWHADGFGTDDVNYIWSDAYPTRIAEGLFPPISESHIESAHQFDTICRLAEEGKWSDVKIYSAKRYSLLRLDPYVVHSVPNIPPPGGERAFLKISISKSKYNLKGNSHNHLFDYGWKMHDRAEIRNDPAWAGGDSFEG